MPRETQIHRIMREQGLLCRTCGEFTRDGLCSECQIERDEVADVLPAPFTVTGANELKAKALGILMTAKREQIILWGREKAFAWIGEQADSKGIVPEQREAFVYAVAGMYLQSLS